VFINHGSPVRKSSTIPREDPPALASCLTDASQQVQFYGSKEVHKGTVDWSPYMSHEKRGEVQFADYAT